MGTTIRRRSRAALVVAGSGLLVAPMVAVAPTAVSAAGPATTVQVSVTTGGFGPGWGTNGESGTNRLVSKDGRYVVYAASGPVVAGQKQLSWQVIRRDRQLGTTTLISRSSSGVIGNGTSDNPSISADGNVVAFSSAASNLVSGDTNGQRDAFVHDVRTGRTTRVSATSTGAQVPGDTYLGGPSISADGKWVGFSAQPQGYAPGDTNQINAYLRNLQTGEVEVVSRNADGTVRDAHVETPVSVSDGGARVAFQSLVGNHAIQVLVRDRHAAGGATTFQVGGEEWRDLRHSISPNGRYVVFDSGDDEIVSGDTNDKIDVFVHDTSTATTERVSVASNGAQGNGHSTYGAISDDGRYVTFVSGATNLVAGDTNAQDDVFRHDRQTGQTVRVSLHANGTQTPSGYASSGSSISGDGNHIVFNSYGVLTSVATGGYQQVYVRDFVGRYPALLARLGNLPARVWPDRKHRVTTWDIRTGPALEIRWTPTSGTKGKAIVRRAAVGKNAFTLRSPKRIGTYSVEVTYAGYSVGKRTITVRKPTAKKLAAKVTKGKRLKVRTAGVAKGQKVQVRFAPRGSTGGKAVKRAGKANAKGVAKVQVPTRTGKYRVVVRSKGHVLRKGNVRIR